MVHSCHESFTAYFTSLCLYFLFCKIKIVVPVLTSQDGCENRNEDQVLLLTILWKCKVLKMWLGLMTFPFIPIAVSEVYSCIHPSYSLLHTQIWSLKTTVTFWSEEKLGALQASRKYQLLISDVAIHQWWKRGQHTSASLPLDGITWMAPSTGRPVTSRREQVSVAPGSSLLHAKVFVGFLDFPV